MNAYTVLVGKSRGRRPHCRHRNRWHHYIIMIMDLKEIVCEDVDWIDLAQTLTRVGLL
jgi:hypothetical protein